MKSFGKFLVFLAALIAAGLAIWVFFVRDDVRKNRVDDVLEQINANPTESTMETSDAKMIEETEVSPISGMACANWNQRALAFMQPGDVDARPAAGFSQADMVIEMPVVTASITRLMGVYICNIPEEVGSMRSARHDFIHLAKGLDAIFIPWGRSESHSGTDEIGLAQGILERQEIENINCNYDAGTSPSLCPTDPCFRKEGFARGVDSGYSHPNDVLSCSESLGYRMTTQFEGYPHKYDALREERPEGGRLRVAFAKPYDVEYEYDPEKNHYVRYWGGEEDVDRNTGGQITPKNIVVMMAKSEQIEGQYNNIQLGDPWYDTIDSGEAFYYMDGKEYRGKWRKDKSDIASKLYFYDNTGKEIAFVPGQIWVEILEPGQNLKWTVMNDAESKSNDAEEVEDVPSGGEA